MVKKNCIFLHKSCNFFIIFKKHHAEMLGALILQSNKYGFI